ncbi:MAG TPA: hypothetical protein VHW92_09645 [Mycobacteriales bacterium]|nr:hypothetical protein [Mycobacteriales bacterium]
MLKVSEVVLILLIPTLVGMGLIGLVRLSRYLGRRHRSRASRVQAAAVPLEDLAAQLRRLHRQLIRLEDAPDGTPGRGLRVRAMRAAYGDSLLDACRSLEVPDAPTDPARLTTAEIYRLESALRDRGLDVRPTALH